MPDANVQLVDKDGVYSAQNPLDVKDITLFGAKSSSGDIEVIDHTHEKIHEGNYYTISKLFTGVANDGFADLRMKSTTKKMHFTAVINAEAKAYLSVFKGSTYVANGTGVTPVNNDLNSANTADSAAYHTPNTPTTGTLILNELIPGTTGGQAIGGAGATRFEFISKPAEDILIRVQNKHGSAAKDISITIEGYEV